MKRITTNILYIMCIGGLILGATWSKIVSLFEQNLRFTPITQYSRTPINLVEFEQIPRQSFGLEAHFRHESDLPLNSSANPRLFPSVGALCIPLQRSNFTNITMGGNLSPEVYWKHPSTPIASFVLLMIQHQVAIPRFVENTVPNTSDTTAPFILWIHADIPPHITGFHLGAFSQRLILGGGLPHQPPLSMQAGRLGLNDYSDAFWSETLRGQYWGYDGPCILAQEDHHQLQVSLSLIALNIKTLPIQGSLNTESLFAVLKNHAIGRQTIVWHGLSLPHSNEDSSMIELKKR